jgi:hypothetical protein
MIGSIGESNRMNVEDIAARRASRFEKLDLDGNGALSTDEIETLVNKIGDKTGVSLNLEKFVAALDKDGSGEITAEEFKNLQQHGAKMHKGGRRHGHGHGHGHEGPPSHRGFHGIDRMPPAEAIKNYAETAGAEAGAENPPPTIEVPV